MEPVKNLLPGKETNWTVTQIQKKILMLCIFAQNVVNVVFTNFTPNSLLRVGFVLAFVKIRGAGMMASWGHWNLLKFWAWVGTCI